MKEINTKPIPGVLELLPEYQKEFDRILNTIREEYSKFGYTPLDTPLIERMSVLLAKAGGETEKQIYSVENSRGNRIGNTDGNDTAELALRFDLTVPMARYVAEHYSDLSFPFKRSHISRVYRGERPQKGRFREFYQCDIDVVGKDSLSIRYDAEVPSIIYRLFKKLDFGKFTIRINNRKIMNGLFEALNTGIDSAEILRIIDKVEKVSQEDFCEMLKEQGLGYQDICRVNDFISISGTVQEVIGKLRNFGIENETFKTGIDELELVTAMIGEMGVAPEYYMIDLSIARGLDYYTGTVYETKLDDYPDIGSVCSGGRYEDLASYYTDQKLPGVGISIGLTRLFYQLKANGLIDCSKKTIADVIVLPLEQKNMIAALNFANTLRDQGLYVDVLLEDTSVKKKFKYVAKKDTGSVVIGDEEEKSGLYTVQYKKDGQLVKEKILKEQVAEFIKNNMHYHAG